MKKFKSFLIEAEGKGATFTFGRFNPPTTGHEKLIQKVKSVAGSQPFVYIHHSHKIKRKTHYHTHSRLHT